MIRDILIHPVLNGYECRIGCATVVFTDRKFMLQELDRYYQDPDGVEKQYRAQAIYPTPPEIHTALQDLVGKDYERPRTARECALEEPPCCEAPRPSGDRDSRVGMIPVPNAPQPYPPSVATDPK